MQDGHSAFPPGRRIHLRQRTVSTTTTGSQIEAGIRGKHHPGVNSKFSSLFRDVISLAGNFDLLAIDGEVSLSVAVIAHLHHHHHQ